MEDELYFVPLGNKKFLCMSEEEKESYKKMGGTEAKYGSININDCITFDEWFKMSNKRVLIVGRGVENNLKEGILGNEIGIPLKKEYLQADTLDPIDTYSPKFVSNLEDFYSKNPYDEIFLDIDVIEWLSEHFSGKAVEKGNLKKVTDSIMRNLKSGGRFCIPLSGNGKPSIYLFYTLNDIMKYSKGELSRKLFKEKYPIFDPNQTVVKLADKYVCLIKK